MNFHIKAHARVSNYLGFIKKETDNKKSYILKTNKTSLNLKRKNMKYKFSQWSKLIPILKVSSFISHCHSHFVIHFSGRKLYWADIKCHKYTSMSTR